MDNLARQRSTLDFRENGCKNNFGKNLGNRIASLLGSKSATSEMKEK